VSSLLDRLAKLLAFFGGLALCFVSVLTATSVIGRYFFQHPIQGDTEIVQVCMAFAVAAFMPLCQWWGGNIIVDFFTTNAPDKTKGAMDRLGAFIVSLMFLMIAWRAIYGLLSQKAANAETMLMQIPEWFVYLLMIPPLALTAVIGIYMTFTGKDGKAGKGEGIAI
jgi:TRAP-type C4-dicarboxylate transport system permease small subunit